MKKSVIICILIASNIATAGFAIHKSSESKEFKKVAEESRLQAQQAQKHAEKQSQLAWQQMERAQKKVDEQKALIEELSTGN